jgi:hypothetical protein
LRVTPASCCIVHGSTARRILRLRKMPQPLYRTDALGCLSSRAFNFGAATGMASLHRITHVPSATAVA